MRDLALGRVEACLYGEPWAILPDKLADLAAVFERRRAGAATDAATVAELEKARAERDARIAATLPGATVRDVRGMTVRQVGRVAVLPMYGTVVQRPGMFTRYSGGVSAEQFAAAHEELVADPAVSAVVWDVDSPGGSVAGVPESADRLFALRGQKKTVAVANVLMASAAYWLGSVADEVVATPSSLTGSIGVFNVHEDHSGANAAAGVRVTYVYAGRRKVEGNSDSPLTPDALGAIQQRVDDYYGLFVAAVARNRKASQKAVREGYGEGDVLTAQRAVAAGLADRIETLDAVLKRLGAKAEQTGSPGRVEAPARIQRQAEAEQSLQ